MIRFVDLETGNIFDGSTPYIFWLDGEQSINLIYSKPICFISNQQTAEISMEENTVFSLIDPSNILNENLESIYGFQYQNIESLKVSKLTSVGVKHHNYYVHIIYFIGSSKQNGEHISNFFINDVSYQIGGDFYGEDEMLYINLSNNGVEIPEAIQKAIYDVNLHEEKRDNITLNRKWKELLSNFWDVVANKGSYKSLYNSLSWFEYGDKVKLCEVWKNTDTNKFFTKDVQELLSEKYFQTLNGFTKTTYMALYYSLEQPKTKNGKILLDDELNPELEYVASKWSTQDLALKLCLLGNFYETYFMPIHLDLLHATIEDVVYTSPFNVKIGSVANRSDFVYNCVDISCNVKDGDLYKLEKVNCYVGPDTLFQAPYSETNQFIIGVQREPVETLSTEEQWQSFTSQFYSDIGTIVDFNFEIPKGMIIKRETLVFKTFDLKELKWVDKTITNYKLLSNTVKFSLLCRVEGDYDVRVQFESTDGYIFTKRIKFSVIDSKDISINVYRLVNNAYLDDCQLGQSSQLDYVFKVRESQQNNDSADEFWPNGVSDEPGYYKFVNQEQYISISNDKQPLNNGDWAYKGACMNHLIIATEDIASRAKEMAQKKIYEALANRYYHLTKTVKPTDGGQEETYYIYVYKEYNVNPFIQFKNMSMFNKYFEAIQGSIYRDEMIFVPEFHRLEPLSKNDNNQSIEQYEITDFDTLCVKPTMSFGKYISDYDWEFVNVSKPNSESIKLKYVKTPFIANTEKMPLEPGFYNIIFRYRLTNEDKVNEIVLDSAFIKV